jgi:hypothetical protein
MSPKETEFWKERLDFAHDVWRRAGLTHDSNRAGAHAWMNAYRGIVWDEDGWGGIPLEDLIEVDGWGGIPLEDLIEVPTAFWVINTQMSGMYARHPVLDVSAERPDSVQAARKMEILINHLIRSRQLGIKRQLNRSLFAALSLPAGIVRHGFTPEDEFFDKNGDRIERFTPARADLPWIRHVPLWDFRADPQAESFHHKADVRWCAFRSLLTLDEIDVTPGLIHRKDLRPTTSVDMRFARPFDLQIEGGLPPEEDAKLVEIWTVYDLAERKWFSISDGSEKTLREPEDWPIQWDQLPYNMLGFHEQMDSPFPVAPISMIDDQLRERNKVRTLMAELVKRTRRLIFADEGQMNEEDMEKLLSGEVDLTEILRTKGNPGEAISVVNTGDFPIGLLNYDRQIEEDIRQTFGQSLLDRGQRINVESGTEAAAVARGAALQSGLLGGSWEDYVGDVLSTFGSALQSPGVLTRRFALPVLGQRDAVELMRELGKGPINPLQPIQSQDIRGSFLYEIRPGSMAPRNPQEEQAKAVANLEVAAKYGGGVLNMPQLLLEYAIAADMDPTKVMTSIEQQQATDQLAANQGVAPAAEGGNRRGNGAQQPQQGSQPPPPALLQRER